MPNSKKDEHKQDGDCSTKISDLCSLCSEERKELEVLQRRFETDPRKGLANSKVITDFKTIGDIAFASVVRVIENPDKYTSEKLYEIFKELLTIRFAIEKKYKIDMFTKLIVKACKAMIQGYFDGMVGSKEVEPVLVILLKMHLLWKQHVADIGSWIRRVQNESIRIALERTPAAILNPNKGTSPLEMALLVGVDQGIIVTMISWSNVIFSPKAKPAPGSVERRIRSYDDPSPDKVSCKSSDSGTASSSDERPTVDRKPVSEAEVVKAYKHVFSQYYRPASPEIDDADQAGSWQTGALVEALELLEVDGRGSTRVTDEHVSKVSVDWSAVRRLGESGQEKVEPCGEKEAIEGKQEGEGDLGRQCSYYSFKDFYPEGVIERFVKLIEDRIEKLQADAKFSKQYPAIGSAVSLCKALYCGIFHSTKSRAVKSSMYIPPKPPARPESVTIEYEMWKERRENDYASYGGSY